MLAREQKPLFSTSTRSHARRWIFLVLLNNEALYPSRPWILSVFATIATRALLQVAAMKYPRIKGLYGKLLVCTSTPKPNSDSILRVLLVQYCFMPETRTSTPLLIFVYGSLVNTELSIRCETD